MKREGYHDSKLWHWMDNLELEDSDTPLTGHPGCSQKGVTGTAGYGKLHGNESRSTQNPSNTPSKTVPYRYRLDKSIGFVDFSWCHYISTYVLSFQ